MTKYWWPYYDNRVILPFDYANLFCTPFPDYEITLADLWARAGRDRVLGLDVPRRVVLQGATCPG